MSWYKKWFGNDYIDVYKHRNEEEAHTLITTLEEISLLQSGHKILDLCCGAGRYAIALAKKGYEVVGIDLSSNLIHFAQEKAREENVTIEFHIRDMRDIPYEDYFNGVVNMFTSFGYFESDTENELVFQGVSCSLKKEGWVVLDFMNRDYILNHFTPYDEQIKGAVTIRQQREFDKKSERINKTISLIKNGDKKEYVESVRLYSPQDLEDIFIRSGLEPLHRFGDYDGSSFRDDSPRVLLVGRKR